MKAFIRNTLLMLVPAISLAQVPVDDDGNVIGTYESQADITPITDDGIPRLSQTQLQELVGPIALYPDDLLAIVLPAAAYPLQIVEAARFLTALESDPSLTPDPDWDDSIVALTNYPEVVELLNDDLEWTLRLGEAVIAQQADVVSAVEAFRDRAYAAGNLKSDEYQTVSNDDDVIHISPVAEDVIYVPYYEPAEVVYYSPRPVYYYHPRPYPVYYYPYAANHYFDRGYFWGVTTAFSIGWYSDSLHVYHHSYRGHPYYGRSYWNNWWYRSPSISVYNNTYISNTNVRNNHRYRGDHWRARDTRREYVRREGYARSERRNPQRVASKERQYEPISFRERDSRAVANTRAIAPSGTTRDSRRQGAVNSPRSTRSERSTRTERADRNEHREEIAFRPRDTRQQRPVATTRDSRRQGPAQVQSSRRTQETGRTQQAKRTQDTRRTQESNRAPNVRRTQESYRAPDVHRTQETRRQQPAVRSQDTRRTTPAPQARQQTRQQAPAQVQRAPARQESRRPQPKPRAQASRSSEPRQQSSSGSSSSSKQRSNSRENRSSRSRDRGH